MIYNNARENPWPYAGSQNGLRATYKVGLDTTQDLDDYIPLRQNNAPSRKTCRPNFLDNGYYTSARSHMSFKQFPTTTFQVRGYLRSGSDRIMTAGAVVLLNKGQRLTWQITFSASSASLVMTAQMI